MNEQTLSEAIEALLVARNPRNMAIARDALAPGYYLRAAQALRAASGPVLIGTGFPVDDTFETDGPVGAIALYNGLAALGAQPVMACAAPLADALAPDYNILKLDCNNPEQAALKAGEWLAAHQPRAVISIERPGITADGRYYNMRGEDISRLCGIFDPFLSLARCPTIAIGDGGNEIGMGKIGPAIAGLDIRAAVTSCDELLVADVSNWGAYGLLAFLGLWAGRDLLGEFSPLNTLHYLSAKGSVDGVTRENTITEDGLAVTEGDAVIYQLRQLTGFQNP
ncbi:MAG TPA: glutamate cyclase domain-containing protein [Kineobactrum sp.]